MNEWVNEWKSFVNTQRFVGSWLGFRTGNAPCPHLCCQSHWGYPDIRQNETHSNRAARTVQCLCICGLFCINKLDFDFFLTMKTYMTIYFGGCSFKFLLLKNFPCSASCGFWQIKNFPKPFIKIFRLYFHSQKRVLLKIR